MDLATSWFATLEAIGMTESSLRVMARFDEQCRGDVIAQMVPAMSLVDRVLFGLAIRRLELPNVEGNGNSR